MIIINNNGSSQSCGEPLILLGVNYNKNRVSKEMNHPTV